jgi:SAM-dependent methyltransferase
MLEPKLADIYLDGRHYDRLDRLSDHGSQDLPFWISQAKRYGDPVLELACGTGRVSVPLAQAGFRVTGIDLSEAMLQEARRKSAAAGVQVDWIQADMRALDLGQSFCLIILPANALCHLLDLSDFEACLSGVRRRLSRYGRLVVSVFVPKAELLIDQPGKRFPFAEYDDPDGRGRIVVTESYVYEPGTQIKRITTHHAIPGQDGEIEGELNMRMYYPQELDALLKYNGFVLEYKYGGFDQAPFGAHSEQQIVVCRKAGLDPGLSAL